MNPGEGVLMPQAWSFVLTDAIGRAGNADHQVDFVLPERAGRKYVAEDGAETDRYACTARTWVSFERFIGS